MRRWLASALIAVSLAGCGGRELAHGPTPVRIAIGGQAQLIYLAATLAQELGFYDDERLAVTLQDFPGGQKSLEALLGGSTDVVCGFYDHTIVMATEHRDLRAFVAMLRYPGLVAVAANPSVHQIEDLKGKIVGVSSAGSSTHFFLNYLLAKHGMKPEDVSAASIGMSATAVAAMTHGKVDAAINANAIIQITLLAPSLRLLDLGNRLMDEFLPAETGVHRHDQKRIDLLQVRQHMTDRGRRIDGKPGFFSERTDLPQERHDLLAKFNVDIDLVCAGFGKRFQQNFGARTHQVNIEKHLRDRPHRFDHLWAKGKIWHKMAVHDVEVQPLGIGFADARGLFSEAAKISRKKRRRDNH